MTDETKTNLFGGAKPGTDTNNSEALDGQGGPNLTPAFSKKDGADENVQRTNSDDIDSASEGAAAGSAGNFSVTDEVEAAARAGEASDNEDSVQYACPTISNLRIGSFQFTNGNLRVPSKDAERFDKLLAGASPRTRQAVLKIDREGGEAVARRFLSQNGGSMTRGGETSASSAPAPNPAESQG